MRDRKTWLANKQATVEDNGNDTKYDAYGFFVKKTKPFFSEFQQQGAQLIQLQKEWGKIELPPWICFLWPGLSYSFNTPHPHDCLSYLKNVHVFLND